LTRQYIPLQESLWRSDTAASLLEGEGFECVLNIMDGTKGWLVNGFPISKGASADKTHGCTDKNGYCTDVHSMCRAPNNVRLPKQPAAAAGGAAGGGRDKGRKSNPDAPLYAAVQVKNIILVISYEDPPCEWIL